MNQVETGIYTMLANRERVNKQTNVSSLTLLLARTNPELYTEQSVLGFFRKLQDEGKGSLIIGRKDNPTRFIWDYNLKEVAQKALGVPMLNTQVTPQPKQRKRRITKIKLNKPATAEVVPVVTLNFELKGANPKDVQALIELANSLKSK